MHTLILIGYYCLYLLGFAAQVLLQAQTSVASSSNGLENISEWVKLHRVELIIRLIGAIGLAGVALTVVPNVGATTASMYFMAGFSSDRVVTSLLFMNRENLKGKVVDTPESAPPPKN